MRLAKQIMQISNDFNRNILRLVVKNTHSQNNFPGSVTKESLILV